MCMRASSCYRESVIKEFGEDALERLDKFLRTGIIT